MVCKTDCELYTMTEAVFYHLSYQNPILGFFMRLSVERLLRNRRCGTPLA